MLGLGLHGGGVSTARWLRRHGATLLISDLKKKSALKPSLDLLARHKHIQYRLGEHRREDVDWADFVIANPGVPKEADIIKYAQKKGKPVYNEATLFFDYCISPIIAVTGTRGKSTTASLIAAMIGNKYPETVFAGNIRTVCMLDVLDRITPETPVVLELSSWQLEGLDVIKAAPRIAVVTNLHPDHLNRYKTLAGYYYAKKEIWKHQQPDHYLVLNNKDSVLQKWQKEARSRIALFDSRDHAATGSFLKKGFFWFRNAHGKETRMARLGDSVLSGNHNIENILAAIAASGLFGVRAKDVREALKHPPRLPGREEVIRDVHGVTYVNDTTATTPVAGIAALERFKGKKKRIILIAGGADKKLDYKDWAHAVRATCKSVHLLTGEASAKQFRALRGFKQLTKSHDQLIPLVADIAANEAKKGDVVLFSPAAASFNLWNHEFERGSDFNNAVQAL